MIILIDHNSNEIILDSETPNQCTFKVKSTNDFKKVFRELFNRIDINGITLDEIDEDSRTCLDEW